MLCGYAQQLALAPRAAGDISAYNDAGSVTEWAALKRRTPVNSPASDAYYNAYYVRGHAAGVSAAYCLNNSKDPLYCSTAK